MSVTRPSDYEKQLQPENDASTMVRMTLNRIKRCTVFFLIFVNK